eukprot:10930937-Ditylum_brightwellii.AAC.1
MKIGDIGGPKNSEQLKKVVELSQRLKQYFDAPLPKKAKEIQTRATRMRSRAPGRGSSMRSIPVQLCASVDTSP